LVVLILPVVSSFPNEPCQRRRFLSFFSCYMWVYEILVHIYDHVFTFTKKIEQQNNNIRKYDIFRATPVPGCHRLPALWPHPLSPCAMVGALLPSPAPAFGRQKEGFVHDRDPNGTAKHLLPQINPNHILIPVYPKPTPTPRAKYLRTRACSRNPDTRGRAYPHAPIYSQRIINPYACRLRTHPPIRGCISTLIHPHMYTRKNPQHSIPFTTPLTNTSPSHPPPNQHSRMHAHPRSYLRPPMSLTPLRVAPPAWVCSPPPRWKRPLGLFDLLWSLRFEAKYPRGIRCPPLPAVSLGSVPPLEVDPPSVCLKLAQGPMTSGGWGRLKKFCS